MKKHKFALAALSVAALGGSTLVVGAAPVSGAATTQTVTIGSYGDQISTNAIGLNFGPGIWSGAQSAARAINKSGIPGRPGVKLKIVTCDTQENPNQVAACGREFVAQHAVAVVGSIAAVATPVSILQSAGIPNIGVEAGAQAADYTNPDSYPIGDSQYTGSAASVVGVKKLGAKNIWDYTVNDPAATVTASLVKAAAKAAGIGYRGEYSESLSGVTDFTPAVTAAEQAGAQSIDMSTLVSYALGFMKTADQLGYHPIYDFTQNIGTPAQNQEIAVLGNNRITEYGNFPPANLTGQFPALKTYVDDMKAELKAGDQGAVPSNYSPFSITSWLSVHVVEQIIEKAPQGTTITGTTITNALNSGTSFSLLGLGPNWNPTNHFTSVYPRLSWPYAFVARVNPKGAGFLLTKNPVSEAHLDWPPSS